MLGGRCTQTSTGDGSEHTFAIGVLIISNILVISNIVKLKKKKTKMSIIMIKIIKIILMITIILNLYCKRVHSIRGAIYLFLIR